MAKVTKITNEHVAAFLAEKPMGKVRANRARKDTPVEAAEDLLRQFSADVIQQALVHGKEKITLSWVIKQHLQMYFDEATKTSEKTVLLDKIMDFIRLGAIQDEALIKRINGEAAQTKSLPDPFTGKLKISG